MIQILGTFTEREMDFIEYLNTKFFNSQFPNTTVRNKKEYIRYEVLDEAFTKEALIFEFAIREDEWVGEKYADIVQISNIYLPAQYRNNGITTQIISLMSCATKKEDMLLYITGIINNRWKKYLIRTGGTEDESGDVIIIPEKWLETRLNKE